MATKQQVIDRLNLFKDDQESAVTIWTSSDVIAEADEMGYQLSIEQAAEIIEDIDRHQDADIGIRWIVLRECIHWYAREHGLEKSDGDDSGRAG